MPAAVPLHPAHRPLPAPAVAPLASQARRPTTAPLFLLPSVALTGMAYAAGSAHALTNTGFLWMTVCCAGFLMAEARNLRTRQGWGAITLYGGVLIWFCMDYFTHWWTPQWNLFPQGIEAVIAKMAFLHTLFVTLMAFGLTLRVPDRAIHWINRYPEPKNMDFLFWFSLVIFLANLLYIKCFSNDDLLTTIYKSFFGGRNGQSGFRAALSGNLNYNILGYLSFVQDYLFIAAITAFTYVLTPSAHRTKKAICLAIFAYGLLTAFGGGTRSAVLTILLPVICILLLRGIQTGTLRTTWHWIVILGAIGLVMIQFQTVFRSKSSGFYLDRVDLSDQRLTKEVSGNTMFSESLDAYFDIPEHKPFFHNSFAGEGAIRAFPQMAFWFAIGPIPRPLWHDKPLDPAWAYRSEDAAYTGEAHQGTTISYGLVGAWYFRFGLAGVIEGGILMGWLYAVVERMLRTVFMRLAFLRLTIALFLLSTLFFFFRDIVFFAIWRIIILYVLTYFAIKIFFPADSKS